MLTMGAPVGKDQHSGLLPALPPQSALDTPSNTGTHKDDQGPEGRASISSFTIRWPPRTGGITSPSLSVHLCKMG